jgi:multidrug resistance efflux pump
MSEVKVYSSVDIWKNVEENAHDSKPLISKRFYTESDFDRVSKELTEAKAELEQIKKTRGIWDDLPNDFDKRIGWKKVTTTPSFKE